MASTWETFDAIAEFEKPREAVPQKAKLCTGHKFKAWSLFWNHTRSVRNVLYPFLECVFGFVGFVHIPVQRKSHTGVSLEQKMSYMVSEKRTCMPIDGPRKYFVLYSGSPEL